MMNFVGPERARSLLLIYSTLLHNVIAAPIATLPYSGDSSESDYTTSVDPLQDNGLGENEGIYRPTTTVLVKTQEQLANTSAAWMMTNRPTSYFESISQKKIFAEDLLSKTTSGWKQTMKAYSNASSVKGIVTTSNRIQIFFADNWLWVFLVLLLVLLGFCIPGMIIQVYCNKYYLSYRREKHQNEKKPMPIEKNNISLIKRSDEESVYQEANGFASEFSQPDEQEHNAKTKNDGDKNSITSTLLNPAQPNPEEVTSGISTRNSSLVSETKESVEPHYRIDVYSGPQVPIYETPPAMTLQEKSSNAPSCVFEASSAPLPVTFPSNSGFEYQPMEVYPLDKPKRENSLKDSNTRNETATAIGNERIVESNSAYPDPQTRPPLRGPKEKAKSKPPIRPPKPTQYRIRPSAPVDIAKIDHTSSSEDKPRRRKRRKHREKQKSKPHSRRKPKESQQARSRQHNYSTKEQSKPLPSGKKPELDNSQIKQIRRRKELLRQIIHGLNEAEMLQCKLERTRKWTREQKRQTKKNIQSPDDRNHKSHDSNKSKSRSHSDKKEHLSDNKNDEPEPKEPKPKKETEA